MENKGMLTQTLRPKNFSELLGNETNKKILKAILSNPDNSPRVLIFGGSFGSGKCVIGSTRVATNYGYIKIEDLYDKSERRYDKEGFTEIKGLTTVGGEASHYYRQLYVDTKEVIFSNNSKIEGTLNHRIKVLSYGKYNKYEMENNPDKEKHITEWRKLGDINTDDIVLVSKKNYVESDLFPKNNMEGYFTENFLAGVKDNIRGWVLGYITMNGKTDLLRGIFKVKILNKEVVELFKELNLKFIHKPQTKTVEFKTSEVIPMYVNDLVIPEFVFSSNKEFFYGFMLGILDSRQAKTVTDKVHLSKVNNPEDFLALFNMLGINPKLNYKKENNSYNLNLYLGDQERLYNYLKDYNVIENSYIKKLENYNFSEDNRVNIHLPYSLKKEILEYGVYKNYDLLKNPIKPFYNVYYGNGSMTINALNKWVEEVGYENLSVNFKNYLELIKEYEFLEISDIKNHYKNKTVYDLTIPETHWFLANGIINHNTTSARIMARELNGVDENSDISNSPYYYELDASIVGNKDSIKEYAPVFNSTIKGGYKVVVLDEIHAASKQAQTLLLKILEEAPKGIFFILCTTDTDKVIDTIKSRALELHFPIQNTEDISEYIIKQGKKLNYDIPEKISKLIAYNSNGHMRNAIMELHKYILIGEEDYLNSSNNTLDIFCSIFEKSSSGEEYYMDINKLSIFTIIQIKKDFSIFINELFKTMVLELDEENNKILSTARKLGQDNIKKLTSLYFSDWCKNMWNTEIDIYTGMLVLANSITKKVETSDAVVNRKVKANSGIKI